MVQDGPGWAFLAALGRSFQPANHPHSHRIWMPPPGTGYSRYCCTVQPLRRQRISDGLLSMVGNLASFPVVFPSPLRLPPGQAGLRPFPVGEGAIAAYRSNLEKRLAFQVPHSNIGANCIRRDRSCIFGGTNICVPAIAVSMPGASLATPCGRMRCGHLGAWWTAVAATSGTPGMQQNRART